MSTPPTRAARRAATAQRILEAAQIEFGEHGTKATIRAIARRAEVDPSLVMQHYGSKSDLFAIAARLDRQTTTDDVADHLVDVLDVRLGDLPPEARALVRSMLTAPEATAAMKDFLDERVANLARASTGADAELKATLTVSSILGLTIARHFLQLDALAEISEAQLETTVRPWLTSGLGQHPPAVPVRRVVIDHLTIGVRDLARSRDFYRAALAPLGFGEIGEWSAENRDVAFGPPGFDAFIISVAHEPGTAHVAFAVDDREQVDAFHAAALAAGGRDNGAPGPRAPHSPGSYGAFVLDPDGHTVEAVFHDPAAGPP
jgi:catechol 2,3-dioxygenase-like lactoylglutathione lyase family enzyme